MYHDSNKLILKAFRIAGDLMNLANSEAGLADEYGLGILSGVMRDCAYRIQHQAEQEAHKTRREWGLQSNATLVIFAAALLSILFASPAKATIILSTSATEVLGGQSFGRGDLAEYDPATDTVTSYFDGASSFGNPSTDIDAAHILDNGNIILSTNSNATLGGLSFAKGELIEYNPTTDISTLYFGQSNLTLPVPPVSMLFTLQHCLSLRR